MRSPIALLLALTLVACGGASGEDPVDTTLPNGTAPLAAADNTTVADMNATEGIDALADNMTAPAMMDNAWERSPDPPGGYDPSPVPSPPDPSTDGAGANDTDEL